MSDGQQSQRVSADMADSPLVAAVAREVAAQLGERIDRAQRALALQHDDLKHINAKLEGISEIRFEQRNANEELKRIRQDLQKLDAETAESRKRIRTLEEFKAVAQLGIESRERRLAVVESELETLKLAGAGSAPYIGAVKALFALVGAAIAGALLAMVMKQP